MGKTFVSPCPFVPLSEYNWKSVHPYIFVNKCPPLAWNPVVYCFVASAHAVSYGLILELMLQLFFSFRKRTTLYFWSLLTCLSGTAMFAVSFDLRFFAFHVTSPIVVLTGLGTIFMVVGFNMTLYSRLNLITKNKTLLVGTFCSVVFVCAVGKVPVVVSESIPTPLGKKVYRIALYMDYVFTVEMLILGGLYIYLFRARFMCESGTRRRAKPTFRLLVVAQLIVAAIDVIANVLLTMDYYLPSATITPLRYAIKVKIEFVVLNRLVLFAQRESSSHLLPHISSKDVNRPDPMDNTRRYLGFHTSFFQDKIDLGTAESATQTLTSNHAGRAKLRTFRSLPDLSVLRESSGRITGPRESSDAWSATDIQYLGCFGRDGRV